MHIFSIAHNLQEVLGKRPRTSGIVFGDSVDTFWGAWGRLEKILGTTETPCGALGDIWVTSWGQSGGVGGMLGHPRSKAREKKITHDDPR